MAKMISNYAINVLWIQPDTSKNCYFVDSNINPNLVEYVTKSCQLWLMWQWVSSFRPKDSVTRAEFWTVLSRALWWDQYEWWFTYYGNHLKALNAEWIMNNISSPMDKEVRGYVMLMMMRSAFWDYYIIDENDVKYPQGCNTPWLYEPEKWCILSMYADNSRNNWWNVSSGTMLVSPALSEGIVDGYNVTKYCESLDILWVSWESPMSHDGSWSDLIKNKSKINTFTASWSSKPGHYWAQLKPVVDINCRLDGQCGVENSSTKLSLRCISWDNPKENYSLSGENMKKVVVDSQISDLIDMLD